MAVAHTLLHDLDDFPLAQQHVAQRHFARTVCIPDVATPLREVFEVRARKALAARPAQRLLPRSEEHTSELQSPCNLVCRLLLEKKKKCEQGENHVQKQTRQQRSG